MVTSMWVVFNIIVLIMLFLDLGVFHKGNRVISIKESIAWSIIWVAIALLFNVGIRYISSSGP
jgi:tellurite resistance protein TerC